MPKRISTRLDALLMAYKGDDKPKKAKVTKAVSQFEGVNSASFNGPFGSGSSTRNPYTYKDPVTGQESTQQRLETNINLSPELTKAGQSASTGLSNNLSFLQTDPNERISFLTGGSDPTYNALKIESDRATENAMGRARLNTLKGGIGNSTAAGGALGSILNDDILRQNKLLTNVLDFRNQNARADAQTNLSSISGLSNLVYPLGSAANSNLMAAFGAQDQTAAANAAAINAAEMQHAQAMNQYNATKNAGMGSGVGSLVGAGLGALLAIPTGGLSLAAGASLGAGLGGAAGDLFGGGGGYAPSGAYIPQAMSYSNPMANYNAMPSYNGTFGSASFMNPNFNMSLAG